MRQLLITRKMQTGVFLCAVLRTNTQQIIRCEWHHNKWRRRILNGVYSCPNHSWRLMQALALLYCDVHYKLPARYNYCLNKLWPTTVEITKNDKLHFMFAYRRHIETFIWTLKNQIIRLCYDNKHFILCWYDTYCTVHFYPLRPLPRHTPQDAFYIILQYIFLPTKKPPLSILYVPACCQWAALLAEQEQRWFA